MFVPQLVPAALLASSPQTGAPVVHEIFPVLQFLVGWHEAPALHVLQVPLPSQTLPEPQLVPVVWLPVPVHMAVPVEQDTLPVWQRLSSGLHVLPSAQAPQVPLLQNCPLLQFLPLSAGLHTPVEQELQVPQALSQQTRSTQWPRVQSLSA
jgi:hypothetical protein